MVKLDFYELSAHAIDFYLDTYATYPSNSTAIIKLKISSYLNSPTLENMTSNHFPSLEKNQNAVS
jgi:hypothetical protein